MAMLYLVIYCSYAQFWGIPTRVIHSNPLPLGVPIFSRHNAVDEPRGNRSATVGV